MRQYVIIIPNKKEGIFIKTFQYTYRYKPMVLDYIMNTLTFNENKKEKEILSLLIKGKTCDQIANEVGYSSTTIKRRRRDLYEMTKDLMI